MSRDCCEAPNQLVASLEELSHVQWLDLRAHLNVSYESTAEFVAHSVEEDISSMAGKIIAWMNIQEGPPDGSEDSSSLHDPAPLQSNSALLRVLETHEQARDLLFSFLDQMDAVGFRTCSLDCTKHVAAFPWADAGYVCSLSRWRACFPRALTACVWSAELLPGDEKHLAGLKEFQFMGCEGLQDDMLCMCSELKWLDISCADDVSEALLEYTPHLEYLSVQLTADFTMHGITRLQHLKELRIELSDGLESPLAFVPPTVQRMHLICSAELSDADVAMLKDVHHLMMVTADSAVNGEFLSELPLLRTLTLHRTTAVVYLAALGHFRDNKDALVALGKTTWVEPGQSALAGELGGHQLIRHAIERYRGFLEIILALIRPTRYDALSHVAAGLCSHLKIDAYIGSHAGGDTPINSMPAIWNALEGKVSWSELICESLSLIAQSSVGAAAFGAPQVACALLHQLVYLKKDSAMYICECLEVAASNAATQEVVASKAGITALLGVLRRHPNSPVTSVLTDTLKMIITTPKRQELLWELGGIHALLDTHYSDTIFAVFPMHSARAIIEFARLDGLGKLRRQHKRRDSLPDFLKFEMSFALAASNILALPPTPEEFAIRGKPA